MIRNIFRRDAHPTDEDLSAYVDGSPSETRRFRGHIEACEACRGRVDDLREVKALVARLPRAESPRSFVLGPQYARVERAAVARGPGRLVLAPIASFVILIALVGVDLSSPGSQGLSRSSNEALNSAGGASKAYSTADSSTGTAERASAPPAVPMTAPATGQPEVAGGAAADAQVPPPTVAAPRTGVPEQTGPTAAAPPAVVTPAVPLDTLAADRDDAASSEDDDSKLVLRLLEVVALGALVGSIFLVWRRRSSGRV